MPTRTLSLFDPAQRVRNTIIAGVVVLLFSFLVAMSVGADEKLAFMVAGGIALFLLSFTSTDFALSVLILSMLLSPEFTFGSAGGVGQMSQRNVVIRLEDLILAIITISWLARTAVNKDLGVFVRTPLNQAIFYYWLAGLFSTILGIFAGNVRPAIGILYNIKYFQYFLIYFMVNSYVNDMNALRRYFRLIMLTAIIVSAYAMTQIPQGQRVSAPFEGEAGEANTLGGYLVLMMAISLGIMSQAKSLKPLVSWGGLLLFMSVPFLYTLSRSSWISLIPVLFVVFLMTPRRGFLLRIGLPVLVILPLVLPDSVYERFEYTFTDSWATREDVVMVGDTTLDPSTSARITSWSSTIEQWTERPVFGWGVTGAGFKDAQYFRILAEAGALGLTLFLYLLFRIGQVSLHSIQRLDRQRHAKWFGMAIGYYAGFWGLLTHGIGANTFIIVRIMEPFWFLTALVIMLPDMIEKEESMIESKKRQSGLEQLDVDTKEKEALRKLLHPGDSP
ncbi:hypothetical protein GF324_02115 [bacterium]|nr:hypothetical protein [bacterium]